MLGSHFLPVVFTVPLLFSSPLLLGLKSGLVSLEHLTIVTETYLRIDVCGGSGRLVVVVIVVVVAIVMVMAVVMMVRKIGIVSIMCCIITSLCDQGYNNS